MIIRVQKRDNPYVLIDKVPLNDIKLSFKAKGILSYLLSKPNNWKPSIEELAKASKDSVDSVRTGLKELEQYGYMKRKRIRGENGKIIGWEHLVFETPQSDLPDVEKPQVEKPQLVKPQVDEPHVENPTLINNELISNDLIINKTHTCGEIVPAENGKTGARQKAGKDECSPEFIAFWKAYPRQKEKARAWRQWKTRLKEKYTPEQMTLAAKKYAIECEGKEEQFIKHPATFIGRDRPFLEYVGEVKSNGDGAIRKSTTEIYGEAKCRQTTSRARKAGGE